MTVVHYTGHIIAPAGQAGRFPAMSETAVTAGVNKLLGELAPVASFGSLAAGADIIVVEAMMARQAKIHVTLPFDVLKFLKTSVQHSGEHWVERFYAAEACATAFNVLAMAPDESDDDLYARTTQTAMRMAFELANQASLPIVQVAVWDGKIGQVPAGTWHDIKTWREAGGVTHIVDPVTGAVRVAP